MTCVVVVGFFFQKLRKQIFFLLNWRTTEAGAFPLTISVGFNGSIDNELDFGQGYWFFRAWEKPLAHLSSDEHQAVTPCHALHVMPTECVKEPILRKKVCRS